MSDRSVFVTTLPDHEVSMSLRWGVSRASAVRQPSSPTLIM